MDGQDQGTGVTGSDQFVLPYERHLKNKTKKKQRQKVGVGRGVVSGITGMRRCPKMCLRLWRKQMQYLCETECMSLYGLWQQHLLGMSLGLCVNFLWGPQLLRKLLSQAQSCPLSRTFSKKKKKKRGRGDNHGYVPSPPVLSWFCPRPTTTLLHPIHLLPSRLMRKKYSGRLLDGCSVLLSVSVCRLNLA